jgi:hypothetical protein
MQSEHPYFSITPWHQEEYPFDRPVEIVSGEYVVPADKRLLGMINVQPNEICYPFYTSVNKSLRLKEKSIRI